MPQLSITKIFNYEAAHALKGYDGLCANIHGHSYRLEVTVGKKGITAEPGSRLQKDDCNPKNGMLMDFSDLKQLVNRAIIDDFDHALVLNADTDPFLLEQLGKNYRKIICTDFQPTSENMILDFAQRLIDTLPPDVRLIKLRLYETATSFAEWTND